MKTTLTTSTDKRRELRAAIAELEQSGIAFRLRIKGKLWQDSNGNSYHVAQVEVNGTRIHTTPITYGYGSAYLQTAKVWLQTNHVSFINLEGRMQSLWEYCEECAIAFSCDSEYVKRKKELV